MPVGAAIGGAVVGGGASLLAADKQSSAARDAANTSLQASTQATQAQLNMYNQTRADLSPFVSGGASGLSGLQTMLGMGGPLATLLGLTKSGPLAMQSQLEQYPGFQFALNQGQQALDRSAASKGLLLSGGQIKDSIAYGQGLATNTFGNYYNELSGFANSLSGLSSLGENAAAQTGSAGSAAGGQIGSSLLQGANQAGGHIADAGLAGASGIAGAANNFGSLVGNTSFQSLFQPSADDVISKYAGQYETSDRRLKTDIRRIGVADSGLPLYSYRLVGSPRTTIGVMADEVERRAPDAVVTRLDGFKMVDYGRVSRLPPMQNTSPLKRAA